MFKERFPTRIEALDALSSLLNSKKISPGLAQDLRRHMPDFAIAKAILADASTIENALRHSKPKMTIQDVLRNLEQVSEYVHCRIGEYDEAIEVFLILQTIITHLMVAMKQNKKLNVALLQ